MGLILLGARVLLAVVFAVAGLAKLADVPGSRKALGDFGAPAPLAAPLGLALPLAELAVALALLPAASAWRGALGALGLLGLFCGGVGWDLAPGRPPPPPSLRQRDAPPLRRRPLGGNAPPC